VKCGPKYQLCSKCKIRKPNQGKAWCELCWKESQTNNLPICTCCRTNAANPGYAWCKQCYDNPQMIDISLPPNWPEKAITHVIRDKKQGKSSVRLFFYIGYS